LQTPLRYAYHSIGALVGLQRSQGHAAEPTAGGRGWSASCLHYDLPTASTAHTTYSRAHLNPNIYISTYTNLAGLLNRSRNGGGGGEKNFLENEKFKRGGESKKKKQGKKKRTVKN